MDDDDGNCEVCSDDFLMADDDEMNDSVTILKDFDPEFVNNNNNLGDDYAAVEKVGIVDSSVSFCHHYHHDHPKDVHCLI